LVEGRPSGRARPGIDIGTILLDVELMLGHRATGLREPQGGTIDMTSEIGHGSTFTVRLPGVAASGSP
jgi:hypothetical protein